MKTNLGNFILILTMLAATPCSSAQSLEARSPADLSNRNRAAIEVTRDKILSDRKSQLAAAMKLTDEEGRAFWPVYDEYAKELRSISDSTVDLLNQLGDKYKELSDTEAVQLAREAFQIEQQRTAIRAKYIHRFEAVLPGKKIARFFQLERRLDAVVVLNVTQAISLVD